MKMMIAECRIALAVLISGFFAVGDVGAQGTWEQVAAYSGSFGATNQNFGASVALSGDGGLALMGDPGSNAVAADSGAAYLYDTTTGLQVAVLTASDGVADDLLGAKVALSEDGSRAIALAVQRDDMGFNSGAAYVFDTSTGNQLTKLLAPDGVANHRMGASVSLSSDGSVALIGVNADQSGRGAAYVFDTTTGTMINKLVATDRAVGDNFGFSVSLSADGSTALVGSTLDNAFDGSAYLFDTASGTQLHKLFPGSSPSGERVGYSVALSGDGTTAFVGSSQNVYVFDTATGTDTMTIAKPAASSARSEELSTNRSGSVFLLGNGNLSTPGAYLYDTTTGTQITSFSPFGTSGSNGYGGSVALSASGTRALVGASGANFGSVGAAYFYAVPEPGRGVLLFVGLVGVFLRRCRKIAGS